MITLSQDGDDPGAGSFGRPGLLKVLKAPSHLEVPGVRGTEELEGMDSHLREDPLKRFCLAERVSLVGGLES